MTDECWLPVVGFEGLYDVSDKGRVRPTRRRGSPGRVLSPSSGRYGHQHIHLWRGNVSLACLVHAVVMEAFVGPRPDDLQIRHLNGDATDNTLANLAYGTQSENELDKVRHGTHHYAKRTHCKNNHEFTPENTHFPAKGGRACRACSRMNYALRKAKAAA